MFRTSKSRFSRLRKDDSGTIDCAAYLLLATIVGIGVLVGIATYRDQVVQQFGDIAVSLLSLDQSYSFTIGDEQHSYDDDETGTITDNKDPENEAPAGIQLSQPPSEESAEKQ